MAKKIKPNTLFDDAIQNGESSKAQEENITPEEALAKAIGADENSIIGTGRISHEDVRKLEQFDAMEKSLAQVSQEKDMLEAKVAEYVEKLESIKGSSIEIEKLKDENKALEAKCKDLEAKVASINKLEKDAKALRDENDQYLIKISELTFENANLTCQLSELEKKAKNGGNVANQGRFQPQPGMQN